MPQETVYWDDEGIAALSELMNSMEVSGLTSYGISYTSAYLDTTSLNSQDKQNILDVIRGVVTDFDAQDLATASIEIGEDLFQAGVDDLASALTDPATLSSMKSATNLVTGSVLGLSILTGLAAADSLGDAGKTTAMSVAGTIAGAVAYSLAKDGSFAALPGMGVILSNPVGRGLFAVAVGAAAAAAAANWVYISNAVEQGIASTVEGMTSFTDDLMNAAGGIADFVSDAVDSAFNNMAETLADWLGIIGGLAGAAAGAAEAGLSSLLGNIAAALGMVPASPLALDINHSGTKRRS